jgi:hypothetical protein
VPGDDSPQQPATQESEQRGPVSGATFTEGISTTRRPAGAAAQAAPPPPAPVPRRPAASVMGEQLHDLEQSMQGQTAEPPPSQPDWASMSDEDLAREIEARAKALVELDGRVRNAKVNVGHFTWRRDGEDSTAAGETGKAIVNNLLNDQIRDTLTGSGSTLSAGWKAIAHAARAARAGAVVGSIIPVPAVGPLVGAGIAGAGALAGFYSGEAKRKHDVTTAERQVTALEALQQRDGGWLAAAKAEQERRRAAGP